MKTETKPKKQKGNRYKEAWMAGAKAGTEVAFEIIMKSVADIGRAMGITPGKCRTRKLRQHGL